MIRLFFVLLVAIAELSHASFLLTQGETLKPIGSNWISHKDLDVTHLLTRQELDQGLVADFKKNGIHATAMPQTSWDLFSLLNYYQRVFNLEGAPVGDSYWVAVNNSYVQYIQSNQDVLEHYNNKNYPEISRILCKQINTHLKSYNSKVKKMYRNFQMDKVNDADEKHLIWLFADTHFPELEQILVKATEIEMECYEKDEMPFWRHSRTSINIKHDKKNLTVMDVPIF